MSMGRIRATRLAFTSVMWILLCMPIQAFNKRFAPQWSRSFPVWFHGSLLRMMGVRVTITGTKPRKGGGLMVANHQGWLDIPVLSTICPLSFVAKAEINKWPFFNILARLQRTVFISRKREKKLAQQRDEISERLAMGATMMVFAEGTSGRGIHVLPFRSSLFSVAEKFPDMPVYPVTVCYRRRYGMPIGRDDHPTVGWYADMDLLPHVWDFFKLGPVDVSVHIHEPIYARDHDRKRLARMSHEQIVASLETLRRHAGKKVDFARIA
ncbi:MAG: 1-acyl-sn-glycerol-3-phosphate acyltransferase [SAR116 cluster bacterium]|jgi:1-acyl-sn-glycerol-3-phosphate acyltransferase|nr:MAG: 1-acyl-sn-glycerol-3-phosphate acyltransferase [SAR116 cluster bacterium]HCJ61656.1 1-acyl-sn-glycerol-3-phosphate acyltransferase [Alphaproteobacteria bacterium]|tara:strand:+ start:5057 stop:5857 length:801 start_codon:yes stop_codon:yes gene_type:complete